MATTVTIILKQRSGTIAHDLTDPTILRDFNLYVTSGNPKGGIYVFDKKSGTLVVDFREVQLIMAT